MNFSAGDLVFIWRKQVTGQDAKPTKNTTGRFVGPARILATEQKRDTQGELLAGSSVWLVRGRRLLKCCPEQLRHASEKEKVIDELHSEEPQPWDFQRVASELGGNDYEDWSESPEEQEWLRAGDPRHEWQPSVRQRGKRAMPPDYEVSECPEEAASSRLRRSQDFREEHPEEENLTPGSRPAERPEPRSERSRSRERRKKEVAPVGFSAGASWIQQVNELSFLVDLEDNGYWTQASAAVEIQIGMPDNRGTSEKALRDLQGYLVSALKKRAIEVSEKKMTPEDKIAFGKAPAPECSKRGCRQDEVDPNMEATARRRSQSKSKSCAAGIHGSSV